MPFNKAPLAAAIVLGLPAVCGAAEADRSTGIEEEVLVRGQRGTYSTEDLDSLKRGSWLETNQSVTIVPSRVIEQRGAATLSEVLRNVSGISLVAGEGGGARGDVFKIRGYDAASDIYLDGVRDLSQYSNRDPFNLQGVEVVKGPASVYSGRGSTGGSINQVSKAPTAEDFLSTNFSLGSDAYQRASVDYNHKLGATSAFRVNGMLHDQEVANRDEVELERYGIAPSLAFGLGTDTRYTLNYFYLEQDNVTDYGLPSVNGAVVPGVDWDNWYGYRDLNREQSEFHSGTFRFDHDFSERLKLRSQFRYQDADLDSLTSGPRTPDTVAGTVVVNPNWRITDSQLAINQTDLSYRFNTGRVHHTLVGGFEISREEYARDNRSPDQVAPLADLYNPDPDPAYDPTFHLVTGVESQADTSAFYLIDTVDIGERWQVAGGARYDDFEAGTETLTTATGITSDFDKQIDMWNYTASVAYKPRRNGSIYLSWGTSYNPSAEAGQLITGAETLDPEENESWELGTKWSLLDRRVDVAAALFRIDKTNARTRELTTDPFRITGEQRVDGIELTLTGQITETWSALAGYAHLESEVLESANPLEEGNELARTPEDTFNLWTSWELRPGVSLGFGANYVGNQTVSTTVPALLENYWLLEASLGYELSDRLALTLNAYNLADEQYIEKAHGGGSHAIPGAGRTALLTVSWRP